MTSIVRLNGRRRVTIAGVTAAVAMVLGLAACGGDGDPVAAPETPPTVWGRITDGIGEDGSVGLDTALAAFSYAIAPLPGAQVPDGEVEELPDASVAIAWTLAHFDELAGEQQAAVGTALSVDEDASSPAAGIMGRSAPGAVAARLAAVGCYGQRLATADSPNAERFRQIVDDMITTIGAKLNRSLSMTTYVVVDRRMNEVAQAYTWVDPGPDCTANKGQVCQIHLTPKGAATSGARLEGILAHEVMHCYIFEILGVKAYDLPAWIGEGLPAWAGESISGGTDSSKKWWRDYLTRPGRSLFARTYDAIGIFGHAEAHGLDLWHLTSPLVAAFDSEPAWDVLVGDRDGMLDSWPSGLLRNPAFGSGWDAVGPGITADKATPRPLGTVANGTTVPLEAPKVAGALGTVDLRADIVEITVEGHARLSLSDGANEVVHGSATWCLKESCACPNGTDSTDRTVAGGPATVAVTGGLAAGSITIHGRALNCDEPAEPSNVDPCVVGTWTSTDIRLGDGAGPAEELPGGAGVQLTIDRSGRVILDQTNATDMGSRIGGNVFATRLAGTGTGRITAVGGQIELVESDFDSTLTWQQRHAFGAGNPQPGTVALDSGTYRCSGSRLELSFPYPLGEVTAVYER